MNRLVQIGNGAWVNSAAVVIVIVDATAGTVNLHMVDGKINACHPAPGMTLDQWAAELLWRLDPTQPVVGGSLSDDDLSLVREWFHSVCDVNPAYLDQRDIDLASKLGFSIPPKWRKDAAP